MKTDMEKLNEYSDKLIREGISPDDYIIKIPVKIFTLINKKKKKIKTSHL